MGGPDGRGPHAVAESEERSVRRRVALERGALQVGEAVRSPDRVGSEPQGRQMVSMHLPSQVSCREGRGSKTKWIDRDRTELVGSVGESGKRVGAPGDGQGRGGGTCDKEGI